MEKMKKVAKSLLILAILPISFLVLPSAAKAATCQLVDTSPQVALNKAGSDGVSTYATGETLTATVTAKSGFSCDGYQVQFMLCPVPDSFLGSSPDNAASCGTGKVLGTVSITNGSAQVNWSVSAFNSYKYYRIKAAAGTDNPNVGTSWQYYSNAFEVLSAQACGISNFSALKNGNGTVIDFKVTTTPNCEGKAVGIQIIIQNANSGESPGDTVSTGNIQNSSYTGNWTVDKNIPAFYFKACVTGGTCMNSGANGINPVAGTNPGPGTGTGTIGATASKSYSFKITNPLDPNGTGGVNTLFDVINVVTVFLLNISIPLAVLGILWAGFLFLTAGPKPGNVEKAKKILTYTVAGLAIIFIGRGFVTLILSVLQLGGTPQTQNQTQNPGQNNPSGQGR